MGDLEDQLKNVYYDTTNPASYGGVNRLVKETGAAKKKVVAWMRKQRTYTTHKPVRRRYPTRRYMAMGIDRQWQADLVEMIPYARENEGYNYLLTVIDVFSRYAWAVPLKRKTPEEIIRGLKVIFNKDQRQPSYFQTDEGTEFENRKVRAFLATKNIEQFSVKSQFKAAMVERFNRTLKTKMWRVFTHRGNYRWLEILPQLVDAYNRSEHRILGQSPASITKENETDVFLHQYADVKKPRKHARTKFQLGDRVRLSKVKGLFEKGYRPNWTEEIFTVHAINRKYLPITYKVSDHRGHVIRGSFYHYELQLVDDSDKVYMIERILRIKGKGKHKQYLVKWLGYDETSWIKHAHFKELT